MRIADQKHVFLAVCSKIPLEQRCNASWRKAGSTVARRQASGLMLLDLSHELTSAIHAACGSELDGQAGLYIIGPGPQLHLGPLSDAEQDALAGVVPIARNGGTVTTAVSANGARILVRLCSNGILETIAFCRPLNESGFVQVGDHRTSSTMFVTYRKFEDLVCGSKESGTRVLDLARITSWDEVHDHLYDGRADTAANVLRTWFAEKVNPIFVAPYPLSQYTRREPIHTLPPEIEAILRSILVLVAPAGPASIQVRLPETGNGRARIVDDSLHGNPDLPFGLKRHIEALCGLAVYDVAGHGLFIPKDLDLHPLRAHALSDIAGPHTLDIESNGKTSAHETIAARAAVDAYWDDVVVRHDLAGRLQVVARGLQPAHFIASIDQWIRS